MSGIEEPAFPIRLTEAQRRVIAKLVPDLGPRLHLDCANGRTLRLSRAELREIAQACRAAKPSNGMERNSLRHGYAGRWARFGAVLTCVRERSETFRTGRRDDGRKLVLPGSMITRKLGGVYPDVPPIARMNISGLEILGDL